MPGHSLTDKYSGVMYDQKCAVPLLTLTALHWTKCERLQRFSLFTMSCLALLPLICRVLAPEKLCREPVLETDVAEN